MGNARLMNKNKKGSVIDLIIFIVVAFLAVFFFGVWIYVNGSLNTAFGTVQDTAQLNFSSAVNQTFTPVYNAVLNYSDLLVISIIMSMIILIFISNFLIKTHPAFMIVYIIFWILSMILSTHISNAYETITANPTLSTSFGYLPGGNFIMLNLPIIIAVVGVIGGIILFAGIIRDDGSGGGVS